MRYKVGDRVKIVDEWVEGCFQNPNGKMDRYLGKTATINRILNGSNGPYYEVRENDWCWYEPAIAGYAPITLEEFFASEKKLVIHCDTKEKAKKLCKAFDNMGRTWCTGNSYVEHNCWRYYDKDTCYTNASEYCSKAYYERENTPIYKFEEIIFKEEFNMKTFKVGDRVRCIAPFDGDEKCVGLLGTIICLEHGTYDCGVEFDDNIDGHSCCYRGKDNHCRWGHFKELELANDVKTITIEVRSDTATATMDGKTVTVNYTANKDLATEVGAKLALDRLFEKPKLTLEVGKYYKLKPYDEVTNPMTICKSTWESFYTNPVKILSVDKDCHVEVCYNDGHTDKWFVAFSSFECEIEPLYNGKVVCIDNCMNKDAYTVGKIYQFVNGKFKNDHGTMCPLHKAITSFYDFAKWTKSKFIEIKEDTTK